MRSATSWVWARHSISGGLVAANPDQPRNRVGRIREQPFDGRVSEKCGQAPVVRTRRTAALDVTEDGDPGVLAELVLQHLLDAVHRDPLAVGKGVVERHLDLVVGQDQAGQPGNGAAHAPTV